jgi:hypothetical protein
MVVLASTLAVLVLISPGAGAAEPPASSTEDELAARQLATLDVPGHAFVE